jgi:manganese/zinc/iron transport system permease protein
MSGLEQVIIDLLLNVFTVEQLDAVLSDARTTAIMVGVLIAVSGAWLGTFLLLRGMSLTSDAISHTVLLGIVGMFLLLTLVQGDEPALSSPWLLLGATLAGVGTVLLTELIYKSGLVRQDAALGLAFPLLFAVAVILLAQFASDAHLDEDAVMVGQIGYVKDNFNRHCLENCETVTITEDSEQATFRRECVNCGELGIGPRDPAAEFVEICANCGPQTPMATYQLGLNDAPPVQILWPQALTVTGLMTLLTLGFVTLFYKELKLASFDFGLAQALGLRPGALHYALMVLVSLVSVGAFDAVGSILVIAFFIIPPSAAYLLTDRLGVMLGLSALIGGAGVYFGYDLAGGDFLGLFHMNDVILLVNDVFDLDLIPEWEAEISAAMVLMIFFFFLLAWVFSPKYGMISTLARQLNRRRRFDNQVVLGHIYHHQGTASASEELRADSLYQHFRWSRIKMARVLARLRASNLIQVVDDLVALTPRGEARMRSFRARNLTLDVETG